MRKDLFAIATVLAAVGTEPARAQNLVVNHHFDLDINGWAINGTAGSFDGSNDANGNPASGSMAGTHNFPGGNSSTAAAFQSVAVVGGTTYTFGGKIFIPSGPNATESAAFSVVWHSDVACTVQADPFNYPTPLVTSVGSWLATSTSATAPAGAICAFLGLNFASTQVGQGLVNFDDVFLQALPPEPPPAIVEIPAVGAGGAAILAGLLAACGLLAFARKRFSAR